MLACKLKSEIIFLPSIVKLCFKLLYLKLMYDNYFTKKTKSTLLTKETTKKLISFSK